jgi:hypothetical protein
MRAPQLGSTKKGSSGRLEGRSVSPSPNDVKERKLCIPKFIYFQSGTLVCCLAVSFSFDFLSILAIRFDFFPPN